MKAKKLVPNLTSQKLRLLKQLFVEVYDKKELIKTLEQEVTIFKKLPEDTNVDKFMKFNKETIVFETCCSLFADLLNASWSIDIGIDGFQIQKPSQLDELKGEGEKKDTNKIKDKMRAIQLVNRDKQLRSPSVQKFIRTMETPRLVVNKKRSVLDLIDNGIELSDSFSKIANLDVDKKVSALKEMVKPEVSVCYPQEERFKDEVKTCTYTGIRLIDIWRYFRLTWSSEYKSVPGKSFPLLIRNAARPNKPIMGIAMLRSAALADTARDDYIGWTNEKELRKNIYSKKLDVKVVVKYLLDFLDLHINELRMDDFDFLNPSLIQKPNTMVIQKLWDIHKIETKKRQDLLFKPVWGTGSGPAFDRYGYPIWSKESEDDFKKGSNNTNNKGSNKLNTNNKDWKVESETPLFKKKRSSKLAKLLEARKAFNEVNLKKKPALGYASLIHSSNKKGADMISRVLREIQLKALAENIMDVSVCGSIAPYNEILGGKLVASLMGSEEVRKLFKYRYASKKYRNPAIISSSNKGEAIYRDANLICLTTTSLYGVASSQYNRIKFLKKDFPELKNDLIWNEVKKKNISQKTKGQGVYHISDRTTKLLDILTRKKLKRKEVNHKFGEGSSPKLRKISLGINLLIDNDLSNTTTDDFLGHAVRRKNYIYSYEKDVLKTLIKKNKAYSSITASKIEDITSAWIKRWLANRITRKETLDKLKELSSKTIKKELFKEEHKKVKNLFNYKKAI